MSNVEKYEEKKTESVGERPWVAPRVDIFESDDELLLVADIPGVVTKKLKVNFDKNELVIEGQVDEETRGTLLGREYQSVDFRRNFVIPAGIDPSKISAELKGGVLNLHLPKTESLKPRQIEVRAG